ncbi:membrane integrity-associated transporter subunit PqiC [Thioclava sp. BHET1]|nr:membrane integrity-associated transporter subunit PqiC [Thioclava sp. BHET1]
MMRKPLPTFAIALLCLPLGLAACGSAPRYQIAPPPSTLRLHAPVATIELNDISLPDYAASASMFRQAPNGEIKTLRNAQWADTPSRGITQALANQLDTILSATVAAEPWPLPGVADAQLTVRVTRDLAASDGSYQLAGTYYVASDGVRAGPSAASFDIRIPMSGVSAEDIAKAQSAAIAKLADTIARGIARGH